MKNKVSKEVVQVVCVCVCGGFFFLWSLSTERLRFI